MEPIGTKIEQISIVVKDVKAAVRVFAEQYGIGPWLIANFGNRPGDEAFNKNAVEVKDVILRGKYVGDYGAKIGICDIGDFQIELIEPLDNKSLFSGYMREHGVGCQHMALDSALSFEQVLGKMAANGFPLSQLSKIDHGKEDCAFADHMRLLGLDIELHNRPGGFEKPPIQPEIVPAKEGVAPLFDRVEQIAFVVEDVRQTVKLLNDQYGIGPWLMVNFGDCHDGKDFISVENAVIDGVEIGTYGVHMAACNALNVQIELLEPTGEADALGRFLKERGPGLHHISVHHPEAYETVKERICRAGFAGGQTSFIDGQEICGYTDHLELLGIYLEIHKRGENFELPKVKPEFYPAALPAEEEKEN